MNIEDKYYHLPQKGFKCDQCQYFTDRKNYPKERGCHWCGHIRRPITPPKYIVCKKCKKNTRNIALKISINKKTGKPQPDMDGSDHAVLCSHCGYDN